MLREIARKIISGELPLVAEADLAKARITVCEECVQMTKLTRQCKLCGCFLDLKTKVAAATCPEGKW